MRGAMRLVSSIINTVDRIYTSFRLRHKSVKIMEGTTVRRSIFEGRNVVWSNVCFARSSLGLGSYVGEGSFFIDARIGRFCSIAPNVRMILGRHPTRDFVSTHPAFFSPAGQAGFTFVTQSLFKENKFVDEQARLRLRIGNDVWIGNGAVILEGCSIGDGAIVAANSLVTTDVAPFSIVAGVPAAHVRYRFDATEIDYLLQLQWWDKDISWIEKNVEFFTDVKELMEHCKL